MNYKDGDAIERPLYWMLWKRGLISVGETPPSRPEPITPDEWAEICRMVAMKTRHIPLAELVKWLGLTATEVTRLTQERGEPKDSERPPLMPDEKLWAAEPLSGIVMKPWEFRSKYQLSRSQAGKLYALYCTSVDRKLFEALVRGQLRVAQAKNDCSAGTVPERTSVIPPVQLVELEEVQTGRRFAIATTRAAALLETALRALTGNHECLIRGDNNKKKSESRNLESVLVSRRPKKVKPTGIVRGPITFKELIGGNGAQRYFVPAPDWAGLKWTPLVGQGIGKVSYAGLSLIEKKINIGRGAGEGACSLPALTAAVRRPAEVEEVGIWGGCGKPPRGFVRRGCCAAGYRCRRGSRRGGCVRLRGR